MSTPISPINFYNLYDFSKIEQAIQSFFVSTGYFSQPDTAQPEEWLPADGAIPFFTGFEAAMFQKHRPRVACFLSGINQLVVPFHGIIDGNGAIRNNMWKANLLLEVITETDYGTHVDLRSKTQAVGEMIAPMVSDPTKAIGANPYSAPFQIAICTAQNVDVSIQAEQGFYGSQLNYQITFGLPESTITAIT